MPRGTIHPNVRVPDLQLAGADDILRRIALDLFMRSVQEVKPEIIRDFAEHVFTVTDDTMRGPKHRRPSPEFLAWAERSQLLPPSVVFGWALRTLIAWTEQPEMRTTLRLPETRLSTSCTFNDAINSEYPTNSALARRDPADPLEAFPDIESRAGFLDRARRHWAARVDEYQQSIGAEATRKRPERHFEWLAQHAVGHHTIGAIRRRYGVKRWDNVKKGIVGAAGFLGLAIGER
jgi:hypothetical protein